MRTVDLSAEEEEEAAAASQGEEEEEEEDAGGSSSETPLITDNRSGNKKMCALTPSIMPALCSSVRRAGFLPPAVLAGETSSAFYLKSWLLILQHYGV